MSSSEYQEKSPVDMLFKKIWGEINNLSKRSEVMDSEVKHVANEKDNAIKI